MRPISAVICVYLCTHICGISACTCSPNELHKSWRVGIGHLEYCGLFINKYARSHICVGKKHTYIHTRRIYPVGTTIKYQLQHRLNSYVIL